MKKSLFLLSLNHQKTNEKGTGKCEQNLQSNNTLISPVNQG